MSTREDTESPEQDPETTAPSESASSDQNPQSTGAWGATSVEGMIFGPTDDSSEESGISRATLAPSKSSSADKPRMLSTPNELPARKPISRDEQSTLPRRSRLESISTRFAFLRDPRFLRIALPILGGVAIAMLTAVIMRYV